MADILDRSNSYGISQSMIDGLVFWMANALGHEISTMIPNAKIDKTVLFFISDILVRNDYITLLRDKYATKSGEATSNYKNAYIASVSFVLALIWDAITKEGLALSFKKNLILNAMGFVGNSLVDNYILPEKYL